MKERGSRLSGHLFILLVGLLPSLVAAGFVLASGTAEQTAADNLARYQRAPPCAAGAPTGCREEIAATVISTYTLGLRAASDRHVVIGAAGDRRWDVIPVSGTLALAPGQPIQAEAWQDEIVLLRDMDGRTLETAAYPVRARARNAGNSGLAKLAGVLAILWAIMFLVIFGIAIRPSPGLGDRDDWVPPRPVDR